MSSSTDSPAAPGSGADDAPPANASPPGPTFADHALAAPVLTALRELGYEAPYPIQTACIPPLLLGRDLLGQAQTGTGKTAAFALPILSRLDRSLRKPQALVLTPTRELAIQVAEAMQSYARHLKGFHVLPVYGGQDIHTQLRPLHRGVHVVVGTPGRLLDHLRRGTLDLQALATLVIDEADEMLRMGFIDEVTEILEHTPATKQVALFSATFPHAITTIAQRYLRDPVEVRIANPTRTVAATRQRYWQVTGTHKLDALTRLLEVEEFEAMLVFVRTRIATEELAEKLEARGFAAAALNGDLSQAQREKTIERLRKGGVDIVVATDVAARGLDVERVSHVINYDVPFDVEAYIHRIGRTGRAGRKGEAILFVAPRERSMLQSIERTTRQPIGRMQLPSREDITNRRVARFQQKLTATIESEDLGFFRTVLASYQRDHESDMDEIAAALAYLVQRERPLQPPANQFPAEPRPEPPSRPLPVRPVTTPPAAAGPRPASPALRRTAHPPYPAGSRPPTPAEPIDPHADGGPHPARERFRIEVGKAHGVEARNIVGAIANEARIEGRQIGPVRIFDQFSIVDLPAGLSPAIRQHLQKVWVGGRQLHLQLLAEATPGAGAHRGAAKKEKTGYAKKNKGKG